VLSVATAIGSTGLAAGGTAGALLAAQLSGTDAAAGLPLGLLVLGSAAAALVISRQTRRLGRAASLASAYVFGAVGALLVVVTAAASLTALLVGSILLGAANAAVFFSRYAAAEVAEGPARGRALGLVFFSTAIGAVLSPLLLGPSGRVAHALDLPRLSGLYLVAAVAFVVAALVLGRASHPSGRARAVAALLRAEAPAPAWHELSKRLLGAPACLGLALLATANFVMVAVMAVAPVALNSHGRDLAMIGTMISLHVAGMFAPSPLSGWLADRVGAATVAATGCLVLLLVSAAGVVVDQQNADAMLAVLVTLGIAWNFTVVGASTLITRAAPTHQRVHLEGLGEAAMGVAAAAAAPTAGAIVALGGFATLSLMGAGLSATALAGSARQLASMRVA
jgi:MFS family permease